MRNRSPGYSASFSRKKQYVQSRLQIGPDGLASTWKPGGAVGGRVAGSAGPGAPRVLVRPRVTGAPRSAIGPTLGPLIEGEPLVALGNIAGEREDHGLGAVGDEPGHRIPDLDLERRVTVGRASGAVAGEEPVRTRGAHHVHGDVGARPV